MSYVSPMWPENRAVEEPPGAVSRFKTTECPDVGQRIKRSIGVPVRPRGKVRGRSTGALVGFRQQPLGDRDRVFMAAGFHRGLGAGRFDKPAVAGIGQGSEGLLRAPQSK